MIFGPLFSSVVPVTGFFHSSQKAVKKLPFLKLDDTFFQYCISGLTDFQDISRLAISGPKILKISELAFIRR
jgi:hypothetical protein